MFHKLPLTEVLGNLGVDAEKGLSSSDVENLRAKHGFNEFEEGKKDSIIKKFFMSFKELMVIILLIAAGISLFLGEEIDAIIILVIVVLNAVISTAQEAKAEKALSALEELSAPKCTVRRNGELLDIEAKELVPGDVVILEAGDVVPADGRLIEASSLMIEESALTGESLPIEKNVNYKSESDDEVIADRLNMVYSSTIVTYGRAVYVVTSTGMQTEIGKIAGMMMEEKEELTPLQVKLKEIGKVLAFIVLGVAVLIFVLGMIQGRDLKDMFFTAVSLAVAAIPEGLPAVVTIVLAIGVQRLSKRKAVIRKLPAVETLGSSSVICSDKTGTLTQNKMTVVNMYCGGDILSDDSFSEGELARGLALCNDASVNDKGEEIGDPTETALVHFARAVGLDKKELDVSFKRVSEIPFDSDRKMMSTLHEIDGGLVAYTKGATDEILERCSGILENGSVRDITNEDIIRIKNVNEELSNRALRVISLSTKKVNDQETEFSENNLVYVGLVGMIDPPREEAKDAIALCKDAGIKTVMITGDHKITARAIALKLGILGENDEVITGSDLEKMSDDDLMERVSNISVYARVAPEHKVRIVKAWQSKGLVVAMTGDGVNDAPALKMAEIGTAMGIVGTDVSRNASDMVLMDDNFATIVSAIEEGRSIYSNIRRTIRFLLSCNMGEIMLLLSAMLLNMKVPLLPVHILWVNLVTDSFPALALGVEPKEPGIMKEKPRDKNKSIFADGLIINIVFEGMMIGVLAFAAFIIGKEVNIETGRTMAFLTIGFTQLAHSINVRSNESVVFKKGLFSNKYSLLAILVSFVLQVSVVAMPFTQKIFETVNLDSKHWLIVAGLSVAPLILVEIRKLIIKEN